MRREQQAKITLARFGELTLVAFGVIAVWAILGIFATSEFYRRTIANYSMPTDWHLTLDQQLATSFIWAVFTPFIYLLASALPLRKPKLLRNLLILILLIPVLATLRAAAGAAIQNLVEDHHVEREFIVYSWQIRIHLNIGILTMMFILFNLHFARREAAEREQHELQVKTLLARAELDDLRTQLQPHFLFTTLLTIADIVHSDPRAADAMIVGLSDLLRRSLSVARSEVRVEEELDFVDRYLDLYRACLGGDLHVHIDVDDALLNERVPALLLQPIVESAVVNGILSNRGGDITIAGRRVGLICKFQITATPGMAPETIGEDTAVRVARERLKKLYGEEQPIEVSRDATRFSATVRIPLAVSEAR